MTTIQIKSLVVSNLDVKLVTLFEYDIKYLTGHPVCSVKHMARRDGETIFSTLFFRSSSQHMAIGHFCPPHGNHHRWSSDVIKLEKWLPCIS